MKVWMGGFGRWEDHWRGWKWKLCGGIESSNDPISFGAAVVPLHAAFVPSPGSASWLSGRKWKRCLCQAATEMHKCH